MRDWVDGVDVKPGEVVLLENCRVNKGEKKNNPELAQKMAALCDIFVHDAFGTAHRAEASTYGIAQFAKIACAGPLLAAEIDAISKALANPKRPLVAIVAGSKVSTKLTILKSLAEQRRPADRRRRHRQHLHAGRRPEDRQVAGRSRPGGRSQGRDRGHEGARRGGADPGRRGHGEDLRRRRAGHREGSPPRSTDDDLILDIGPKTARQLAAQLMSAGTIVWNGPVGVFEFDAFANGTETIARAIAKSSAFCIAGGGDTLAAIAKYGIETRRQLHLHRRRRLPRSAGRQDPAGLRDPGKSARTGETAYLPLPHAPDLSYLTCNCILGENPKLYMVHGDIHGRRRMARRATKIVATLGPASSDPALLEQMIRAGVNVVRLNFSHGTAQDHIDRANMVREAAQRAGREVAIMADLQGPKIRVGKFAEGKVLLEPGAKFVLDASRTELGDINGVGLDYKELPRDVKPGDMLLLNDGLIVLTVDAVRGEQVHTTVKLGGELSNNKGINKQGGGLTAPALTAKDMEDIQTAMSFQADYVAVSFPKNATDMEMARQLCNVAGAEYRPQAGADRQDRARRSDSEAGGHPQGQRRHHGGARRPGGGGGQRRRAGAAETHDPHGARARQGGDHRDPDDGVDDHQPGADARRGERRRQRRARRHRRRDAERRNGRGQVPGGDHRQRWPTSAPKPRRPRTSSSTPTSPA